MNRIHTHLVMPLKFMESIHYLTPAFLIGIELPTDTTIIDINTFDLPTINIELPEIPLKTETNVSEDIINAGTAALNAIKEEGGILVEELSKYSEIMLNEGDI